MEAITTKFALVALVITMVSMLESASADGGYGNTQPQKPLIPKPDIPKEEHGGYGTSYPTKPSLPLPKPVVPKVPEHPKNIAVQGLIYCKYGSKFIPLKGATARVTCLCVDKNGYESAPFSFSSCPADENGYFLAKMPPLKGNLRKLTECKAFLEKPPQWSNCKVPEDVNGGISGAHLTSSRLLDGFHLSSVGPFLYTPEPQALPKGEGY